MPRRPATRLKKVLLMLALVGLAGLVWQSDNLTRLHKVVTLFGAQQIVGNFSNMPDIMLATHIANPGVSQPWPIELKALPESYRWKNEQRSIEAFLTRTMTTSLLVLHNGVLVYEDYRLGTGREDRRISWSMAKSFLSALFGIAVAEGQIDSIEDSVTKYVPELNATAYKDVPIRHVLNMASGVQFDEDYLAFGSDINKMGRVLAIGGSMDAFAQTVQQRARPAGMHRSYVSIDTHVLSMVLRTATGRSLQDYFAERLWAHLNPEGEAWYLTDGHDVAFALGGLNMQSRDYARFGELFRNQGRWQGQQILPAAWVSASTQASAPPPLSPTDPFGYGFQWWVPPKSDGEFFAVGIYGQYIYVNPAAKVVVVKTSAHRGFRADGNSGKDIKHETIQMMRALATHYSKLP